MPVVSTSKDPAALTMTLVGEFPATVDRVWRLWADARRLERWWGPPAWPATFERHDFTVGGASRYYMTGPDGDCARGWWEITELDAPTSLTLRDGFAGDDGEPVDPADHVTMSVELAPVGPGTRMTVVTRFQNIEQMTKHLDLGMEEGMRQAAGQIDGLLADGRP
ncbi:SRPBCC family protein [Tsukamurella soli]|uniref:SRPBCC domain-containing protein n=1 Tax=Tsukamurella soli TaxID=644556 RepID=A0ABP8K0C8_9ACTN